MNTCRPLQMACTCTSQFASVFPFHSHFVRLKIYDPMKGVTEDRIIHHIHIIHIYHPSYPSPSPSHTSHHITPHPSPQQTDIPLSYISPNIYIYTNYLVYKIFFSSHNIITYTIHNTHTRHHDIHTHTPPPPSIMVMA